MGSPSLENVHVETSMHGKSHKKSLSILQKKMAFKKQIGTARKKHFVKSLKAHAEKTRMDRSERKAKIKAMLGKSKGR